MEFKNKSFCLIKFGVSEIKRKNIKQTYTLYTDWFKENNYYFHKNRENVFKDWKKLYIYEEAKKEPKITREISFLKKNGFAIIYKQNNQYCFKATDVSRKWSDNGQSLFYLKNIDYSFFQFLLKQKYIEFNKEKSAFVHIVKNLLINKKITSSLIISNSYIDEIKKMISNKNEEGILNLVKYNSGSPNNGLNDKKRDLITKLYINYYFEKKDNEKKLVQEIKGYLKSIKKPANGLLELIFNKKNNDDFDYGKKALIDLSDDEIKNKITIKNDNDFLDRIKNKIIAGSYPDYKNLIINHINCLSSFFDISKKDNEWIFNVHDIDVEKFLHKLVEKENDILKLEVEKFYEKNELLEKLNITINENKKWNSIDERNDFSINKEYTYNNIKKIINKISQAIETKTNEYNFEKIKSIINNDNHIKGQVNWPTYYEFIIGMIFLKKTYGEYSTNWKEKIDKHLRLTIDGSLCPIRFAGGGKSDIFFLQKNIISIIEPTTQLYRQTKQEHDSVKSHLNDEISKNQEKKCYGLAIIVAPKIEETLVDSFCGFNNKNKYKQILLFDNNSLIDILNYYDNQKIWDIDFLKSLIASDFINNDNCQ